MVHTDLFLSIQPGTDAALALGVAKYIVDNNLYDTPYVKEQTDLPLLVDKRTNLFVRAEGSTDRFFFHDAKTGKRHEAPGSMGSKEKTIALNGADPDLHYSDGDVITVFEPMKQKLAPYTLESVAQTTGLALSDIKQFAHEFATRKPAMIIHGAV